MPRLYMHAENHNVRDPLGDPNNLSIKPGVWDAYYSAATRSEAEEMTSDNRVLEAQIENVKK